MIEGFDRGSRGNRRLRKNHIDTMLGQIGKESIGCVLIAHDLHGLVHLKGGPQNAVCNELRYQIGDANEQAQRSSARASFQDILQFASEAEDFVRVPVDDLSDFGEGEATSLLDE